jgi:AcrR family transcriptional regulator
LIGELGWGRVSTRAIAERAGVPHGAVSYHFRGKQDLLRQAAMAGLQRGFGEAIELASRSSGVAELLSATAGLYDAENADDEFAGLLIETLREAVHDEWVAGRVAEMLTDYRSRLTELIRADQQQHALTDVVSPQGLAVVLAALLDGLLFHVLIDPTLSAREAIGDTAALLGLSGGGEVTEGP